MYDVRFEMYEDMAVRNFMHEIVFLNRTSYIVHLEFFRV